MEPLEPLLDSVSPNGDVFACVEQDDATCYFYLRGENEDFGVRSCWVRNLRPAPEQLEVSRMRDGVSPMLPRAFCRHPAGASPLSRAELEIVWSEEGDSAALREHGGILAVIPLWSGREGFHGYARDCIAESPLCWPLGTPATNVQFERYQRAEQFWSSWDGEGPWPTFQTAMCNAYAQALGPHSNYYAIDGGNWPPKALLRIPRVNDVFLVTAGMALRPQPGAELHYKDPSPHRRIELGIKLESALNDASIKRVASYLSGQTTFPWTRHTFLGSGHTMPADVFGELSGGIFSSALLQIAPKNVPGVHLPEFRDDPITLLWMTPISPSEQAFAEEHGSDALAAKLTGAVTRHSMFNRPQVV